MERQPPDHREVLAEQLGADHATVLLSERDSQSDLHDQCHRVGQHVATQGHEEPGIFFQRRIDDQAALLGAAEYFQEMDNADPQLAIGIESVFNYV